MSRFGIFDGHGGSVVSQRAAQELPAAYSRQGASKARGLLPGALWVEACVQIAWWSEPTVLFGFAGGGGRLPRSAKDGTDYNSSVVMLAVILDTGQDDYCQVW